MADEAPKDDKKDAKPAEGEAKPGEAGADGAPPTEADLAAAAAAKKKKLVIIGIVAGIVLIGAGAAVFFLLGSGEKKAEEEKTEVPATAMFEPPEFTVNLLSDDPATQHFLKVKLALELMHEADAPEAEKLLPRLQDDWGGFLRQLRPMDMQGSAALQRLKEALLRRANQVLTPIAVKAVYIREMLVQ